MDAHTLELLQFDKVRDLLAGYAASSLGRDLAQVQRVVRDTRVLGGHAMRDPRCDCCCVLILPSRRMVFVTITI